MQFQSDAEESWNDVPPQLPSETDSTDECDQVTYIQQGLH